MQGRSVSPCESGSGLDHVLEKLEWDSEHFGFPVACLTASDLDEAGVARSLEAAIDAGFRLIYWTTGADRMLPEPLLATYGGLLADRRAVFELSDLSMIRQVSSERSVSGWRIVEHERGPASPRLVELAISAGEDSRFNRDKRIPRDLFEGLYEIWIQRSTRGELADAVLVAETAEGKPIGLITIAMPDGSGKLGLLAVAEEARGRGVGSRLMESAHRWMATRYVPRAWLITQLRNQAACRLFSRMGYKLAELANVYHFWPTSPKGGSDNP